jgi:hypothetical protein
VDPFVLGGAGHHVYADWSEMFNNIVLNAWVLTDSQSS